LLPDTTPFRARPSVVEHESGDTERLGDVSGEFAVAGRRPDGEPAAVGVEQDLRGVRPGWEGPEARNAADVVFAVAHVLGLSGGLVPLVEDRTEQPHRHVGHAGEQLAPVGVERAQGVRFGRDARRCGGRRRGHQFLLRDVTDRDRSGVWRRTHCDASAWSATGPTWNAPGVPERHTHSAVTEAYHRGTRGTVNGGLSSLAQVMDIRHPDEMAGSAGEGRGVSRAGTRGDHASRPTFRRAGPVADRLGPDTPQPRGA